MSRQYNTLVLNNLPEIHKRELIPKESEDCVALHGCLEVLLKEELLEQRTYGECSFLFASCCTLAILSSLLSYNNFCADFANITLMAKLQTNSRMPISTQNMLMANESELQVFCWVHIYDPLFPFCF